MFMALHLQIIRMFMYIKENQGIQTAFQFLSNVWKPNLSALAPNIKNAYDAKINTQIFLFILVLLGI